MERLRAIREPLQPAITRTRQVIHQFREAFKPLPEREYWDTWVAQRSDVELREVARDSLSWRSVNTFFTWYGKVVTNGSILAGWTAAVTTGEPLFVYLAACSGLANGALLHATKQIGENDRKLVDAIDQAIIKRNSPTTIFQAPASQNH